MLYWNQSYDTPGILLPEQRQRLPGAHTKGKEFTCDTNEDKTTYDLFTASFFADSFPSLRLCFRFLIGKTDRYRNKDRSKNDIPWNLHRCLYTGSQPDHCIWRWHHIAGCLPYGKRLSDVLLYRWGFQDKVADYDSRRHGIHLHTESGCLWNIWDISSVREQRYLPGGSLWKCHRWQIRTDFFPEPRCDAEGWISAVPVPESICLVPTIPK